MSATKKQLVDYAEKHGVEVPADATVAEMTDAVAKYARSSERFLGDSGGLGATSGSAAGEALDAVTASARAAVEDARAIGVLDAPAVEPTESEQEEAAAEVRAAEQPPAEPVHEPEVRPDEFSRGILAAPAGATSPLAEDVLVELRKPLDPNRVRTRKGRGSGQFEYLAGHDVKRRASEIFGFGNWGYRVVTLEETELVEVAKDDGSRGVHVSYMAVVEVTVRGCLPFSDVGYGDGVEYGPAARATARELASKESVTDALKRGFTGWGDQFGLVLYAKGDDAKRGGRERNREDTTGGGRQGTRRQEQAGRDPFPVSLSECGQRIEAAFGGGDFGSETMRALLGEIVQLTYGVEKVSALTANEKREVGRQLAQLTVRLEELGPFEFGTEVRSKVQAAVASVFGGLAVNGPEWRLGPDEPSHVPDFAVWKAEQEALAREASGDPVDADVPAGEPAAS